MFIIGLISNYAYNWAMQDEKKTEEIKSKLRELGFSEAETLVYMFLVRNGAASIQTITDAVSLPRSTVNLSVEKLTDGGLVSFFVRGKRKNYVPKSLENLMNYFIPEEQAIQNKKRAVQSLLPDLESIFYLQQKSAGNVEFMEGEDGFRKLYDLTLDCEDKEILRLSIASEKFNFIPDFLKEYVVKKNDRGIKTRLIVPETEFSRSLKDGDAKDNRETRYLDKNSYNPDIALAIWDGNVAMTVWDRNLKTIIIKSEIHADFFKSIFNILWNIAQK